MLKKERDRERERVKKAEQIIAIRAATNREKRKDLISGYI